MSQVSLKLVPITGKQHPITALPKFTTELPFFYLTKQKSLLNKVIDFRGTDPAGRPVRWKVSPNIRPEIGAPGIEAHEVWVRLIKPSFDAERSRVNGAPPSIVPLGSMRECLRILGWTIGGWEAQGLMTCIRQISFAVCEADFWLPTTERDEEGNVLFRLIKGEFARMSIYAIGSKHLTDEELLSGKFSFDFDLEDTVYLHLHPIEVEMQRNQPQQPIDNEYLFSVSPASRRWYELLAPKFFGVIQNKSKGATYCEIRYSWYIQHHPTLKRHSDRYRVVYQMNRLVRDHLAFGYISKVEYRAVKEPGQEVDYIIRYYPGDEAKASTNRIRSRLSRKYNPLQLEFPLPPDPTPLLAKAAPSSNNLATENDELTNKLLEHGVHPGKARELVSAEPEEVRRQLEYLPYRMVKKNKGGLLRDAIIGHWTPPDEYLELKKKQLEQQDAQERLKKKRAAEAETAARQKQAEESKRAYFDYLKERVAQIEQEQPKVYKAFVKDTAAKRAAVESDPAHKGAAKKIHLRLFDDEESRLERFRDFFNELTLEQWSQKV